jgi:hypothetical protein
MGIKVFAKKAQQLAQSRANQVKTSTHNTLERLRNPSDTGFRQKLSSLMRKNQTVQQQHQNWYTPPSNLNAQQPAQTTQEARIQQRVEKRQQEAEKKATQARLAQQKIDANEISQARQNYTPMEYVYESGLTEKNLAAHNMKNGQLGSHAEEANVEVFTDEQISRKKAQTSAWQQNAAAPEKLIKQQHFYPNYPMETQAAKPGFASKEEEEAAAAKATVEEEAVKLRSKDKELVGEGDWRVDPATLDAMIAADKASTLAVAEKIWMPMEADMFQRNPSVASTAHTADTEKLDAELLDSIDTQAIPKQKTFAEQMMAQKKSNASSISYSVSTAESVNTDFDQDEFDHLSDLGDVNFDIVENTTNINNILEEADWNGLSGEGFNESELADLVGQAAEDLALSADDVNDSPTQSRSQQNIKYQQQLALKNSDELSSSDEIFENVSDLDNKPATTISSSTLVNVAPKQARSAQIQPDTESDDTISISSDDVKLGSTGSSDDQEKTKKYLSLGKNNASSIPAKSLIRASDENIDTSVQQILADGSAEWNAMSLRFGLNEIPKSEIVEEKINKASKAIKENIEMHLPKTQEDISALQTPTLNHGLLIEKLTVIADKEKNKQLALKPSLHMANMHENIVPAKTPVIGDTNIKADAEINISDSNFTSDDATDTKPVDFKDFENFASEIDKEDTRRQAQIESSTSNENITLDMTGEKEKVVKNSKEDVFSDDDFHSARDYFSDRGSSSSDEEYSYEAYQSKNVEQPLTDLQKNIEDSLNNIGARFDNIEKELKKRIDEQATQAIPKHVTFSDAVTYIPEIPKKATLPRGATFITKKTPQEKATASSGSKPTESDAENLGGLKRQSAKPLPDISLELPTDNVPAYLKNSSASIYDTVQMDFNEEAITVIPEDAPVKLHKPNSALPNSKISSISNNKTLNSIDDITMRFERNLLNHIIAMPIEVFSSDKKMNLFLKTDEGKLITKLCPYLALHVKDLQVMKNKNDKFLFKKKLREGIQEDINDIKRIFKSSSTQDSSKMGYLKQAYPTLFQEIENAPKNTTKTNTVKNVVANVADDSDEEVETVWSKNTDGFLNEDDLFN